jgi:fatty acid desaturase
MRDLRPRRIALVLAVDAAFVLAVYAGTALLDIPLPLWVCVLIGGVGLMGAGHVL